MKASFIWRQHVVHLFMQRKETVYLGMETICVKSLEQALKSLTVQQEKDILLLELHRLMKQVAIGFGTYEKAKEMWGDLNEFSVAYDGQ